jgi:hypothetical protein
MTKNEKDVLDEPRGFFTGPNPPKERASLSLSLDREVCKKRLS